MKKNHTITLIPGDGIGPEVTGAAKKVIEAAGVSITWDIVEAGAKVMDEYGTPLPEYVLESIKKNKIALKGPITTPVGSGFRSVNVALRQTFNLYANVRPIKTYEGIPTRYKDVDLIIVRENTEDLYAGIEHKIGDYAAESIKIITREASERIADFAFDMAVKQNRKKVTAVHKANIMKFSDGLFLDCARKVAEGYKEKEFEDMIVDAMSMKLVQNPEKYDVLVMPNLYGDILSDMAAGLVGGLGVAPGANIGKEISIFESIHGSAPDIAGKNIANPTAAILSGVMMLRYIGELEAADKIDNAIKVVLKEGTKVTSDLGGNATTDEFANEVIKNI
ncbi:isocitrate dehydrogenase (NAD+) [Clostridium acetobutylicum]|uniref:Isocitrate dehydrogenase n=1 Tax=Clostridium acetobutylicum (strain ATCC 824 / DSM 792 / JCM 1419 / IAM 19013 / LMG 5710 / NBRC 13948 / NRRL B-527 / VKM B-1787 / 2291 / W) TaxID=272562 RepID=Q97KE7_CLOAB|nr:MULTISPECIES: isocitrate dehydrogenase (NAD(+)) [Clostridium]AAK78948.1 Isocitrate dehydrogenase [Clostridium acetobutylicum ATCC 824]ADZ20022.1 Isocitrate dehydrogenase [Clostridium acetobutylicum EA 2018]AEI33776.1 isocitrate dehydrogenase [Clostridium acetobutylicum DSM 1731]AWV81795.1 isocitrate dehydrogenase (NAD(+)) [Clostridium acetobutylicum]KHD35584.1 isocitrate dehydrogenase [Clostridium acetobutylicum]